MNLLEWTALWATSPIWAFPVTWVLYVFATHLKAKREYLQKYNEDFHPLVKIIALPLIFIGLVLDAYTNIITFTFLLRELPQIPPFSSKREFLVTSRLNRHLGGMMPSGNTDWEEMPIWYFYRLPPNPGWRIRVSWWIARTLLLPFDQNHFKVLRLVFSK